jgi:hypothetical protein
MVRIMIQPPFYRTQYARALCVIIAIILSFRIHANQTITCPHCHIEFTKDIITFQDHALVACRFCHRWMYAATFVVAIMLANARVYV